MYEWQDDVAQRLIEGLYQTIFESTTGTKSKCGSFLTLFDLVFSRTSFAPVDARRGCDGHVKEPNLEVAI